MLAPLPEQIAVKDDYGSLIDSSSTDRQKSPHHPHISILKGDNDNESHRSPLVQSLRSALSSAGSVSSSVRDLIVDGALHHEGPPVSVKVMGGKSTITRSSFTLVKNLVGAGVLALPSGVAAFADSKDAIGAASCWLVVMGAAFAYEFQLIAKVCDMTRTATFREAFDETVGKDEALAWAGLAVSWVNMLTAALSNLTYSMILADTFKSLFATVGWEVTRAVSLLLVTLPGILPLCLLKNLDALAPCSIVGTLSIVVIAICMGIRCFDGSYDPSQNGQFLDDLSPDMQPVFGNHNGSWKPEVLVFVAMIFQAFVAHYNAPRLYAELKDTDMPRFRTVVANGFGSSTFLNILIMSFGFLTFGGNCDGDILNNYSDQDSLMTVSRVFIAISILFTYPVTFMGTRDGVLGILSLPEAKQTTSNINIITIVLLTIITFVAAVISDFGMVNAVGGGSLDTLIVFVFPALMYRSAIHNQEASPKRSERREATFSMVLLVVGCIMGAIGVAVELLK